MNITMLSQLITMLKTRPDLMGPRTVGSVSEIGLEELSDRPVHEFRPKIGNVPVARYFGVECPEIQGRLGVLPASDLTAEELKLVKTRFVAKHGLSFYLDQDEADLPPVTYATVIIGPVDGSGTLGPWTWFPGNPTGTMTVHDKLFTDTPVNQIGVKLTRNV